jgi:hypothetical protein
MTNLNTNETVASANENVVSHDNSIKANPNETVPAVDENASKKLTVYQQLDSLIVQREVWEDELFRASNDRLYNILRDCYALYVKTGSREDAEALKKALDQQANMKGFKFTASAHTLTKIVKCIFGADRRRASAYSIALRAAHAARVKAENLPDFLRSKGGVEEVRLAKGNAMKAADKAVKAADFVAGSELAVVNTPSVTAMLDTAKIDEYVVLVAQQGADGVLTIKAVVQSKTVVDTALASVYSQNKEQMKTAAAGQTIETNKASSDAAMDAALEMMKAA